MEPVDLAVVLAFDASASVTFAEFNLIAGGCAAALRAPEVVAGLTGGALGASLAAVLVWSGHDAREVMVDWTRLGTPAEVAGFADAVENVPRMVRAGGTAIGEALLACEQLLKLAPVEARRQVIDVAGDGRSNEGAPPGPIRDRLAAAGVTVNGLCVLREEPDLLDSYTREVIGGPGAFALACADYTGFAEALTLKLRREVA